jgi:hypothetical protein
LKSDQENGQPRGWSWRRIWGRYGIGAVVLVFFLTVSLHFRYTPDDTYVYLQYGRSIAQGGGFSFNDGVPSYGVTAPLWAALIAAGTSVDLDPYIVAKTLDIVFASLAVIAVYAFAFILIRDPVYALVAACIFSFDAWMLRWSGSGMESSLAVLLMMLTLWYGYRKEYFASALVAGLLTLVRPEGALLFLAILLDVILNGRDRRYLGRTIAGTSVLYGIIVGLWILFSLYHFGSVLPNAFRARVAANGQFGGNVQVVWSMMQVVGTTQLLAALLLVVGIVAATKRIGWRGIREDVFPLAWIFLVLVLYAAMGLQVGSRSLLPLLPVIVVYGAWGVKRLELASIVSAQRGFLVLLLVACFSLVQNQYVYRTWILPHMENFEEGMNECLKPMAYWLRSNAAIEAKVLTTECGIVRYVSEREVYDAGGRIAPEVQKAFSGVTYEDGMARQMYKRVLDPDYVIDRSLVPGRLASGSLTPIMTRAFSGLSIRHPELTYYTLYRVVK